MAIHAKKSSSNQGLGTIALAGVVISSMVGGGIFSLPQNMASSSGLGAVILAWLLTGFGMYFIASTFRTLSVVKPDLTAGIYMYSREGFGPFAGFIIGWGYWLCQIFGNVGYAVITMDALNYFFPPYFSGGNTGWSILGGSFLIWMFNFIVCKGVKQATILNFIGTIFKLVPLFIFLIIVAYFVQWHKFGNDFWGLVAQKGKASLGGVGTQIKSTMLVTLWAFIGIEGAVVLSNRAKNQNNVGRATLLGFLGCWVIYVLLSILPFGVLTQPELAQIPNPSTAGVLQGLVGVWGSVIMNIGLIVAVLSSWLAWTMITAEIPFAAAKNGTFPKIFTKENKHNAPVASLIITSCIMQISMILVYYANNAWNTMLSITGVMVLPAYFMSSLYLWKFSRLDGYPKKPLVSANSALVSGILGSIYAIWLMYAAGLEYLLMAVVFVAIGIPLYIWNQVKTNDSKKSIFTKTELAFALILIGLAILAIILFSLGIVKI